MGKVTWTIIAREDLKEIGDYIALDSLMYAKRTISTLISRTKILKSQPFIGRSVPEQTENSDIRKLIEVSYPIIYKLFERDVLILSVIKSDRLLPDSI